MTSNDKQGMLLGKHTPVVEAYAPELLYPIDRSTMRDTLGSMPAMYGADLWHAYELSWLDARGKPVVRVGRFVIPAASPCMVESKSFKLYLNSLNNTCFAGEQEVAATIRSDIAAVVGISIEVELLRVDDKVLSGGVLPGKRLKRVTRLALFRRTVT